LAQACHRPAASAHRSPQLGGRPLFVSALALSEGKGSLAPRRSPSRSRPTCRPAAHGAPDERCRCRYAIGCRCPDPACPRRNKSNSFPAIYRQAMPQRSSSSRCLARNLLPVHLRGSAHSPILSFSKALKKPFTSKLTSRRMLVDPPEACAILNSTSSATASFSRNWSRESGLPMSV